MSTAFFQQDNALGDKKYSDDQTADKSQQRT
jgi:hypothetical protein